MTTNQPSTRRVAVFGTGTVGGHALRAIARRDDLELVAVKVYSAEKAGRDVGEILGGAPTGVVATEDVAEVVAAGPECVLYCPNAPSHDDIVQLLEAGIDVITVSGGYLFYPFRDAELTARLSAACERGGSTFHGTGVNPGFMSARYPLSLATWCRRIDVIRVVECAVMVDYPSTQTLFDLMHFGQPLDPANCTKGSIGQRIRVAFEGMVAETVLGLGAELEDIVQTYEEAPAPRRLEVAAGVIEEGTLAGQRWRWSGIVEGRPLVEVEVNWVLSTELEGWPNQFGWKVEIEGDPNLRSTLETFGGLNHDDDTCIATAMQAVNAVHVVCDAAPGIRTFLDLPPTWGRHVART